MHRLDIGQCFQMRAEANNFLRGKSADENVRREQLSLHPETTIFGQAVGSVFAGRPRTLGGIGVSLQFGTTAKFMQIHLLVVENARRRRRYLAMQMCFSNLDLVRNLSTYMRGIWTRSIFDRRGILLTGGSVPASVYNGKLPSEWRNWYDSLEEGCRARAVFPACRQVSSAVLGDVRPLLSY